MSRDAIQPGVMMEGWRFDAHEQAKRKCPESGRTGAALRVPDGGGEAVRTTTRGGGGAGGGGADKENEKGNEEQKYIKNLLTTSKVMLKGEQYRTGRGTRQLAVSTTVTEDEV